MFLLVAPKTAVSRFIGRATRQFFHQQLVIAQLRKRLRTCEFVAQSAAAQLFVSLLEVLSEFFRDLGFSMRVDAQTEKPSSYLMFPVDHISDFRLPTSGMICSGRVQSGRVVYPRGFVHGRSALNQRG